jgi:hypothetical protein
VITTFGASLIGPRHGADPRAPVHALVEAWLDRVAPAERRGGTVRVAHRGGPSEAAQQVELLEPDSDPSVARATTVTLLRTSREWYFDVRRELKPTRPEVLPRRSVERPDAALCELLVGASQVLRALDAERRIEPRTWPADSELEGQSVAAYCQAPSRRLPVVVEVTAGKGPRTVTSEATARQLLGVAHLVHLTSADAEKGFTELFGTRLVSDRWVTVVWPRPGGTEQFHDLHDDALMRRLIGAASASLVPLARPPAPRPTPPADAAPVPAPDQTAAAQIERLNALVLEREAEIEALHENMTLTDQATAARLDALDRQIEQLMSFALLGQDASYLERLSEAVDYCKRHLRNLVFHERAIASAHATHMMNGRSVAARLAKLDELARPFVHGRIDDSQFVLDCMEGISNFAPSVSDTAVQQYAEDYAIDWHGVQVLAKPHIRVGDARIHFYLDRERRQVVVAYVGRHLRDKGVS